MHTNGKGYFAALGIVAVLLAGCSVASPLRRSEARIRASLLERTPPGTPEEDVNGFMATQRRWHLGQARWVDPKAGARSTMKRAVEYAGGPPVRDEVTHMLQARFGHYRTWPFFLRYVYGYWGFDTNDHLVDIWIYKVTDAM
jgi:hypothetical protein